MKEVLPETGMATQTLKHSARWYQAAMLNERIPLLKQMRMRQSSDQANEEKAHQRLARWKNLPPFRRSSQQFEQRLEMDGLNEEMLFTLLSQPAEEVEAAFPESPAWLVALLKAFAEPDPAMPACLPIEHIGDEATDAIFLALKPLLEQGFARLQMGIADLQQRYQHLPFDPQTIGVLLLPHFVNGFLNKPAKVLILEMNVARVRGELQGEKPEECFLFFLQQLAQPEKMLALLEEYPVLARQLAEMVDGWVIRELELLQRLCADWDEIRTTFTLAEDLGVLNEIKEGVGDTHQGGRSVTILIWSSGLRLVYKPRSLSIDMHFQEVLTWLNACGCQPAFRVAKLINKEEYGWYEYFSVGGCTTQAEIERFYQRMGGYLALLYALEATDFHAENLIAAGENPMLIDLESLFQSNMEEYKGANVYGYELLTHSVRRVGILPQRHWLSGGAAHIDLSALGAPTDLRATLAANTPKAPGIDEMLTSREQADSRLGLHRPTLQGVEVSAFDYEQSIIAGFTTVYRLLLQHRDELLNAILPRFAHDPLRMLIRQTHHYSLLLSDSSHPDVLRDALDRDWLFDRLWIGIEHRSYLTRAIAAERADLWNGDVPKFTTCPDSRDLFTSRGERIADFLPISGLDLARKGIQALGESDMERQIWIIRASFACMELNNTNVTPKRSLDLQLVQSHVEREAFLAEAMTIADRLQQLALVREDMIGWLTLNLVDGQEWRPVPVGPDLYSGLTGITFFLAYLGELSGEKRYTSMARLATKTLQTIFLPRWQWGPIGAFDGVGSIVYLFSHLGTLWHEPVLYQGAEEMIPIASALLEANKLCDLLAGAAGYLAALLSLYAVSPREETLEAAIQCGEHILNRARTMPRGIAWSPEENIVPLAGMSHGNAGIALSLLRLAEVSKDERFRQAALEAMEYERGLFSPEKRNWPDLREAQTLPGVEDLASLKYMTAWCHGAPGVGLARLASLRYHDDAAMRAEIDAVVQTTLDEGFGRNHSLCHGDMGNLEVLQLATQLLPERYSREKIEPLQAGLLATIRAQGWISGIPQPIETPGLMLGLAGTGYALLRLADPERIPSVLVLDPPTRADQ